MSESNYMICGLNRGQSVCSLQFVNYMDLLAALESNIEDLTTWLKNARKKYKKEILLLRSPCICFVLNVITSCLFTIELQYLHLSANITDLFLAIVN